MVVDNRGIPVEGAEVFVYGNGISCLTDHAGHYSLTGIESGSPRYIVGAVKSGYLTGLAGEIDVVSGGVVTQNLVVSPKKPVDEELSG